MLVTCALSHDIGVRILSDVAVVIICRRHKLLLSRQAFIKEYMETKENEGAAVNTAPIKWAQRSDCLFLTVDLHGTLSLHVRLLVALSRPKLLSILIEFRRQDGLLCDEYSSPCHSRSNVCWEFSLTRRKSCDVLASL
jgi:hypothetical protein